MAFYRFLFALDSYLAGSSRDMRSAAFFAEVLSQFAKPNIHRHPQLLHFPDTITSGISKVIKELFYLFFNLFFIALCHEMKISKTTLWIRLLRRLQA